MRFSEIKEADAIRFAKLEGSDISFVEPFLSAAKGFVKSYTGLKDHELDQYAELAVAVLVIFTDMYDNRSMTAEQAAENRTAKAILEMHCRNLVMGGDTDD